FLGKKDPNTPNQQIVKELTLCDSMGIIHKNRTDLNAVKLDLLNYTNPRNLEGSVFEAILDADVFIGVSKADLLDRNDIRTMAKDPFILALANPIPEIFPDEAFAGGAFAVGTGRSDFPNQVNNVLAFPGIFLGAIQARAPRITLAMKFAAAEAIAAGISHPTKDQIIPPVMDESIALKVADAVRNIALNSQV
ncbi:MAG TPA: malic enzyme-like NAD(P)-binding protein, partial [Saprospiraceae bacterium]|nr:malic enzyme-like NAD(P)-binding protein [Saprospiraceae bacterium]